MKKLVILIIFVFIFLNSNIFPGNPCIKYYSPFINNYKPDIYRGYGQVWDIIQDKNGLMYFANSNYGIIQFDGFNWNKVENTDNLVARSLAIDKNGKIFAGFNEDIGYLKNKKGKVSFVSLKYLVPKKHKNIKTIWQTVATKYGVYFRTSRKLFRYYNKKITVIESKTKLNKISVVNNRVLIMVSGNGLMEVKQNSIVKIKNGYNAYKLKILVYSILPYKNGKIILFSRNKGVYIFDWNKFYRVKTDVGKYLTKYKIYTGIKLPDNRYAIGTKSGGILILNENAKLLYIINKISGLNDNNIRFLYCDKNKGLWTGLNYGISFVELFSPFRIYSEKNGVKDNVNKFEFYKNSLYFANSMGISKKIKSNPVLFKNIAGIDSEVLDILRINNSLLIAGNLKYLQLKRNKLIEVKIPTTIFTFARQKFQDKYLICGTRYGILILENQKGLWKQKRFVKNFNFRIDKILWINKKKYLTILNKNTLAIINFINGYNKKPRIKKITAKKSIIINTIFKIDKNIYYSTPNAFYCLNNKTKKFTKIQLLKNRMKSIEFIEISQGKNNRLWFIQKNSQQLYLAVRNNNKKYIFNPIPITGNNRVRTSVVYDKGEYVLIGSHGKIIKYSPKYAIKITGQIKTTINKIKIKNKLVYGIYNGKEKNNSFRINYDNNSITFYFSCNDYTNPSENKFSYKLSGLTEKWSSWSNFNRVSFSHLSPGNYTFRVKSQNIYGVMGKECKIQFKILSPWYRTFWMYILYSVMIIGTFFGFSFLRSKQIKNKAIRLEKEKALLEKHVADRTKELQFANDLITQDLIHAKRIQNNTISKEYKNIDELDIEVYFNPMTHVGGDIYDIYELNSGYYRVLIADTTGHGVQAALTTMLIKSEYDKIKVYPIDTSRLMELFNNIFLKNYINLNMFFTCTVLDIDMNKEEIHYTSAGHPEQYLIIDNTMISLTKSGPMVGLKHEVKYEQKCEKFPGEALAVLYTDGIFEEFNENEEEFGEQRLNELIDANKKLNVKELNSLIVNKLKEWTEETGFTDDITLISIQNVKNS